MKRTFQSKFKVQRQWRMGNDTEKRQSRCQQTRPGRKGWEDILMCMWHQQLMVNTVAVLLLHWYGI